MAPWVKHPGESDSRRRAALEELRLTLGAVECAVELMVAADPPAGAILPLADIVLRQLERGRRALGKLAG